VTHQNAANDCLLLIKAHPVKWNKELHCCLAKRINEVCPGFEAANGKQGMYKKLELRMTEVCNGKKDVVAFTARNPGTEAT